MRCYIFKAVSQLAYKMYIWWYWPIRNGDSAQGVSYPYLNKHPLSNVQHTEETMSMSFWFISVWHFWTSVCMHQLRQGVIIIYPKSLSDIQKDISEPCFFSSFFVSFSFFFSFFFLYQNLPWSNHVNVILVHFCVTLLNVSVYPESKARCHNISKKPFRYPKDISESCFGFQKKLFRISKLAVQYVCM